MGLTPTLRLKKLDLTAFRSFVDQSQIELPETGIHQIRGASGAGKTGFVEGIAYALDYSEIPATTHQTWSWLTDESMQVELDFMVGNQVAKIRRGKKSSLVLDQGSPWTSASVVKQRLRDLLGMEPRMLKALTYRPQRQLGLFLGMTDSDKKTFLTSLLKLGPIEEEIDRTQKLITSLEKEAALAQARYEQASALAPQPPTEIILMDLTATETQIAELTEKLRELEIQQTRYKGLMGTIENSQKSDIAIIRGKYDIEIQAAQRILEETRQTYDERLEKAQSTLSDIRAGSYIPDPEAVSKLEKLKSRLQVIQSGIAKFRSDYQLEEQECRYRTSQLEKVLWNLEQKAGESGWLGDELTKLTGKLAILENSRCPTCAQTWANDSATKKIEETKTKITGLNCCIAEAAQAQIDAEKTKVELKAAQQALTEHLSTDPVPEKFIKGEQEYQTLIGEVQAEQKSALTNFQADKASRVSVADSEVRAIRAERDGAVKSAESSIDSWKAKRSTAIDQAGQPTEEWVNLREGNSQVTELIKSTKETMADLVGKLTVARKTNELTRENHQRQKQQYEQAEEALRAKHQERQDLLLRILVEEDFLGLVKSFLGLIFDETLQSISAKANELLVGVPNVAGMTLEFSSEHETKTTGTIRQEIKTVIRKDGHEVPFRASCSGGQQATIELAVDLSLATVIAERTGCLPGWLVLDEPFDGLDTPSKEACMNVLSRVAVDRAIFVIDHSAEVKEMFDTTIEIGYLDGKSMFLR